MTQAKDSSTALWGGIAFSFAFTGLIWYAGAHWLQPGALTPDRPGFWYEWQLVEPTVASRATAWAASESPPIGVVTFPSPSKLVSRLPSVL